MHRARRGGFAEPNLTNTVVFDVRLRSASKGVTGTGSGTRVYRRKQDTAGCY